MSMSRANAVGIALTLGVVVLVGGVLLLVRAGRVGGLPPTYDARDHDQMLSREAATAQPLIAALTRYHAEHGLFPPEASVLGVALSDWIYAAQPSGYTLSKKLRWDPTLHYRFEGDRGRWVFDPGDGSPEREIAL
jgi:hypothetical protein